MKWIKASERLPEKDGEYFVKIFSGYTKTTFNSTCDFEYGEFQNRNRHTIVEWLDESEEEAGEKIQDLEKAVNQNHDVAEYWKQRCEIVEKMFALLLENRFRKEFVVPGSMASYNSLWQKLKKANP